MSLIYCLLNNAALAELPRNWFLDVGYYSIGSCEENNLNFNAARFTKLKLNKTRDNLEIYLQIVLFLNENNQVRIRLQELGLVECRETSDGEVCSYRPYPETKKLFSSFYDLKDSYIEIANLGSIKRLSFDFPWHDFELEIDSNFFMEEIRGQKVKGGKVQINFNHEDKNSIFICKKNINNIL